jgi:MFS family permease
MSVNKLQPRLTSSEVRLLALASLGGALEFYDFVIFVFFTSVIGKLFFAAGLQDWVRQTETFGLFAAGYFARPLGGMIIAHFGDRYGRKKVFTLSLLLMAMPTLAIGLLPTYRSIGISATLLLLALRVMQGVAIGGEAPGAWVFVAEHAPQGRSGLAIGLMTSGLSLGILLGSSVALIENITFTQAQIFAGAWRLPFLLGGVFGMVGMYLRRWLRETPVFEQMKREARVSTGFVLGDIAKHHVRAVFRSIGATWMLTASILVIILMSPTLLQKATGITPKDLQIANLAGTAILCFSTVAVAFATDRFGVRKVSGLALLVLVVATYALYSGIAHSFVTLMLLYCFAGVGAGAVVLCPIMMVDAFPPTVRFSGVSFAYNLAYAFFGGITPLLVSWLSHLHMVAPAHYVAIAAITGLLAMLAGPRKSCISSKTSLYGPQTAMLADLQYTGRAKDEVICEEV